MAGGHGLRVAPAPQSWSPQHRPPKARFPSHSCTMNGVGGVRGATRDAQAGGAGVGDPPGVPDLAPLPHHPSSAGGLAPDLPGPAPRTPASHTHPLAPKPCQLPDPPHPPFQTSVRVPGTSQGTRHWVGVPTPADTRLETESPPPKLMRGPRGPAKAALVAPRLRAGVWPGAGRRPSASQCTCRNTPVQPEDTSGRASQSRHARQSEDGTGELPSSPDTVPCCPFLEPHAPRASLLLKDSRSTRLPLQTHQGVIPFQWRNVRLGGAEEAGGAARAQTPPACSPPQSPPPPPVCGPERAPGMDTGIPQGAPFP